MGAQSFFSAGGFGSYGALDLSQGLRLSSDVLEKLITFSPRTTQVFAVWAVSGRKIAFNSFRVPSKVSAALLHEIKPTRNMNEPLKTGLNHWANWSR
jgi:hypothetical protein